MIRLASFLDYGFSVSALWCSLATPTILLGFLLPWTWGISSRLLQQSSAFAPYLGRGRPSWPWTWSSSRPILLTHLLEEGHGRSHLPLNGERSGSGEVESGGNPSERRLRLRCSREAAGVGGCWSSETPIKGLNLQEQGLSEVMSDGNIRTLKHETTEWHLSEGNRTYHLSPPHHHCQI